MVTIHMIAQVKRSLEWLHGEGAGNKRYAAVLILRQMAENAPAVFNVHVRSFIEIIWAGLRDPKVHVREASVAALRVPLWSWLNTFCNCSRTCLAGSLYSASSQHTSVHQ